MLKAAMPNPAVTEMSLLRALPSVDQLLRTEAAIAARSLVGLERTTTLARAVTEGLRREIVTGTLADNRAEPPSADARGTLLVEAARRLQQACQQDSVPGIRRVINATGVILHTNLGRAPLSAPARDALTREAAGYCTLEYDVASGERGKRGARTEELLIELTGAEDALVVNNCAAAALLILTVLAKDGQTIVSRGELVEIGGDFRVPDVMASSGTQMIEVGTTNRTKLEDYARALNESTRLIMRVHQSNYRIVGFTTSPAVAELSALAHEASLPLYEDAGSGALLDLSAFGLADEPVIRECVASGADVISFSGDKLLGAVQAGLIVGRREIVTRLRKHPLFRALRADKLCLAALEATLESYRRGASSSEVPTIRMLALAREQIHRRANNFLEGCRQLNESGLSVEIIDGTSAIGGGSGPNTHPPTALIAVTHADLSTNEIECALRYSNPPIITRIAEDRVLIDLRTVEPHQDSELLGALKHLTRMSSGSANHT